jgi:hypothetical protein
LQFQFHTKSYRALPKAKKDLGYYLTAIVAAAGLVTLLPFLAVGYSKLLGWNSISTFMTLVSLAGLGALLRKSLQRRDDALKAMLAESHDVMVDDHGLKISKGALAAVYHWKDIEHVAGTRDTLLFRCREDERFEFKCSEIGTHDTVSELFAFVQTKIELHGQQLPNYFRFVIELDGDTLMFPSVIVDSEGFRILKGVSTVVIPWRNVHTVSEKDSIVVMEFMEYPLFAFAKGPFKTLDALEAFLAFSERMISETRLH